jgi:transposase
VRSLEQRAAEAEARAEKAEARVAELEAQLGAALARITELGDENRRLRARLDQDSSNSSRPPSSDRPGAKAEGRRKVARVRGLRKAGGQRGHMGRTRELRPVEEADEVVHKPPDQCGGCGHGLSERDEVGAPLAHQQYELPPLVLQLIHYWLHRRRCPQCGKVTVAGLTPEEASGQGPRLTAFIGLQTAHNRQSRRLVSDLLWDLFRLRLSIGTVQACWERLGEALAKPNEELEQALVAADSLHLDETGWRQWGKRCWLWVATTAAFTVFMIHPRRGADALKKWFPDGFLGTVNSDRWSAYSYFDLARRQLCWSHLGRDLQAIIDAKGVAAPLAAKVREGEAEMYRTWHALGEGALSRQALQEAVAPFRAEFRKFCQDGRAQTADDLWQKLGRGLLDLWPAVFRFVDVEGIEPTNNAAEQAVRPGVILRKLSQGTRSDAGSLCIGRVLSVTATCHKQGRDVLDYLTAAITAHWAGIPPPPLLMRE